LIKIKLHRGVCRRSIGFEQQALPGGRPKPANQELRRLLLRSSDRCPLDPDCKSPHNKTPAKITNTVTTAAETTIESTGMATSLSKSLKI